MFPENQAPEANNEHETFKRKGTTPGRVGTFNCTEKRLHKNRYGARRYRILQRLKTSGFPSASAEDARISLISVKCFYFQFSC